MSESGSKLTPPNLMRFPIVLAIHSVPRSNYFQAEKVEHVKQSLIDTIVLINTFGTAMGNLDALY